MSHWTAERSDELSQMIRFTENRQNSHHYGILMCKTDPDQFHIEIL